MSVIQNIFASREVKVSDLRNPDLWLINSVGATTTTSGERVDNDAALALPTYFACMRVVSEDVAKLPLIVYRRLVPRGKERAPDHNLYSILHDEPKPGISSMTFREVMMHFALGFGNGFAYIYTDRSGNVEELELLHPLMVSTYRKDDGTVYYERRLTNGDTQDIEAEKMFHLRGMGSNGITGYSVLQYAAESLGLSLAAQKFGAAFFANSTRPSGILEHPGTLTDDALKHLRSSWEDVYKGAANTGKPAILEEGMAWKQLGIPPNDAQFLETRQLQVEEICRWFRVPPHKIQHLLRATYSNIEHQSQEYYTDTLLPWLVRFEQEVQIKLLKGNKEYFAEHLVTGILRGDQAARSQYYREQFMIGALSQNDIRELENRNPIDGGDVYYVPMNMTRTEDASQGMIQQSNGSPGQPPMDNEPRGEDHTEQFVQAQMRVFEDAAFRVLRKEIKAASRAAAKHKGNEEGFAKWLDWFYSAHADLIIESFKAPSWSLFDVVGGDASGLEEIVKDFAASQIMVSRRFLSKAFLENNVDRVIADWLNYRPEAMAAQIVRKIREN